MGRHSRRRLGVFEADIVEKISKNDNYFIK
jgi:hypothetical protein